jgi:hypothetical protein
MFRLDKYQIVKILFYFIFILDWCYEIREFSKVY